MLTVMGRRAGAHPGVDRYSCSEGGDNTHPSETERNNSGARHKLLRQDERMPISTADKVTSLAEYLGSSAGWPPNWL